jgi:mannitol-1-/sugar-/sorbitol-6-/2-deoxyglucose-6-phosphatase
MPIEAVIFDMDGVLVDSEEYWWQSRLEFAGALGKTWTMDDQRQTMGRNTVEWGRIMQERLSLHEMPLEDIMNGVKSRVIARLEARLPLLPGAVEAVHTAAQGYPVALASGSPKEVINKVMQMTRLNQVFQHIVYADDMPRGKPAPDVYLATAKLLNVDPARCLGIEDSGNGLRSLKAAGMIAIAVPSPGFPLPSELLAIADHVMSSLEGFSLDLVQSLGGAG